MELIPDETAFIQLKTKYRGVTYLWVRPKKSFMPWYPIMDDGYIILVAISEEIVQRACNDDVQIQKQCEAMNWQISTKQAEFSPAVNHFLRG